MSAARLGAASAARRARLARPRGRSSRRSTGCATAAARRSALLRSRWSARRALGCSAPRRAGSPRAGLGSPRSAARRCVSLAIARRLLSSSASARSALLAHRADVRLGATTRCVVGAGSPRSRRSVELAGCAASSSMGGGVMRPTPSGCGATCVAAVSHDLRTPITSLRLLTEAIADDVVDDDDAARYLRQMSTHVDALVGADRRPVRAVAARGGRDRVEPRAGARSTSSSARPSRRCAPRPTRATCAVARRAAARAAPGARANPEKLQRVLFNLIQNAIRHTPADGSVVVRAEPAGDAVEIEVADTGDGHRRRRPRPRLRAVLPRRRARRRARATAPASASPSRARSSRRTAGGSGSTTPPSGTRVRFSLPAAR